MIKVHLLILMQVSAVFGQMEVGRLSDELGSKTISLNPEFAVFGKGEVITLKGEGHAAGRTAFENEGFVRWMFAQKN